MNYQILLLTFILAISLTESRTLTEANKWIHRSSGQSDVKLLHIRRDGPVHTIHEFVVNTQVSITTDKEFTEGDNSDVIATDSQKNIIYLLAKKNGITSPELFALQLCEHFFDKYEHVTVVKIEIKELPWRRMEFDEKPHIHAFISSPEVTHSCKAVQNRGEPVDLTSGLDGLQVLKTTKSSYINFISDEYRTLPNIEERIFSNVISAYWTYNSLENINFEMMRKRILEIILDKFAGPPDTGTFSPSVDNTLYITQKAILDEICLVNDIEIIIPNFIYKKIDLSKFPPGVGFEENKEVYLPVDDPSALITAKLKRGKSLNAAECSEQMDKTFFL